MISISIISISFVLIFGIYFVYSSQPIAKSYDQDNLSIEENNSVYVCEKSYRTLCIPKGDISLTCDNVLEKNFPVKFDDPNNFDPDENGIGCELK